MLKFVSRVVVERAKLCFSKYATPTARNNAINPVLKLSSRKFTSNSAVSNPTVNLYGQTYDQIVKHALAGSKKHFQLVYPFQNWTWPPPPKGFIDSKAYRFVGQVPQWSAIGRYQPGASDMHDAYLQVLSLPNALGDGVNTEQLRKANEQVTSARNKLLEEKRVADAAYSNYSKTTPAGTPVQEYDTWMAKNWGATLANATAVYHNALQILSLIANQKNPGLKDAIDTATPPSQPDTHKAGFAQVRTGATIGTVPNYIFTDPNEWTKRLSDSGSRGMSMSIQISASESSSSAFSESWAGGSTSSGLSFFEVLDTGGAWERLHLETEDKSLSATINIRAYSSFDVTPDPTWYNSGLLSILGRKDNWNPPYSTKGGDGKKPVFGKDGVLPLVVTGLVAGYQPSIQIKVSDASYAKHKNRFDACAGMRIGPFQIGGKDQHTEGKWSKDSGNETFNVESNATYPFIMGITVASPGL